MNRSLLLLLLLIAAQQALALAPSENDALQALFENIPSLGLASPAWSSNTSLACGSPGFYGITCSEDDEPHVVGLKFDIDMLNGSFPRQVAGLKWLTTLDITHACFSSWQLAELSALTELRVLNVSNTVSIRCVPESDNTTLPTPLSALKKLEVLSISVPGLIGTFPSDIGNLVSLRVLSLRYPYFPAKQPLEGNIADSITNCQLLEIFEMDGLAVDTYNDSIAFSFPHLREFKLTHNNHFFSSVHDFLKGAPELLKIDVSYSRVRIGSSMFPFLPRLQTLIMDGIIDTNFVTDDFWRNLASLEYFSCKLSKSIMGSIGPSIQYMKKLKYFDISESAISGPIPPEIDQCEQLESLVIQNAFVRVPLPSSLGSLAKLKVLKLSNLYGRGELPNAIGKLQALETLVMSGCGLTGTIPSELANATNLNYLDLHENELTGPIPEFRATQLLHIDLHENGLNGTIPHSIARNVTYLDLRTNNLGPELAEDLFIDSEILYFDLSHNHFRAPLPQFSKVLPIQAFRLSYNDFHGTIPRSYCTFQTPLLLDHNNLNGTLDNLFADRCGRALTQLDVSNNNLGGTIPSLLHTILVDLYASSNSFTGDLPQISGTLKNLDLSSNKLQPTVQNFQAWAAMAASLERLDISDNSISTPSSYILLITPKLTHLSVARTWLLSDNQVPPAPTALVSLDLEGCHLRGPFDTTYFPHLTTLKLADNLLYGSLGLSHLPALTYLDISNNQFQFDVDAFTRLPSLSVIKADSNRLFGTLVLNEMPSLQQANFGDNQLHFAPDLTSIGLLFHSYSLRLLNITFNVNMLHIKDFDTNSTGLDRTLTSKPSERDPKLFKCFSLDFFHRGPGSFLFDEPLFDYRQCDCDENHFGLPPNDCFECPKAGVSDCGGLGANVEAGYFALWHESKNASTNHTNTPSPLSTHVPIASPGSSTKIFQLSTESCLHTTIQTLTGRSNCRGLPISPKAISKFNNSIDLLLQTQCKPGSEGRLCSKCICPNEEGRDCYFENGPVCTKCKAVLKPSQSAPILVGISLVIILLLTTAFVLVLRSKRQPDLRAWKELSLPKRIFYRLLFITTLGNVSILVTFLQILLEFTKWDVYIKIGFFGVINGDVESFGLRCSLPFLIDPMAALLVRLSIPFVAIIFIVMCIGLAVAILSVLERANRNPTIPHINDPSDAEDSPMLESKPKKAYVAYPAIALMTSTSITMLKFFYFGTALSAHEYLFSTIQAATGIKYVQNKPWMLFKEAHSLIMASLPTIIMFDALIPLLFLYICWKYRHSFYTPTVQIYFGSLFSGFARRCFWWELVNTLKKLSIALVLRAIPAGNALQSALIVTILGSTLVFTVLLHPWRRKTENVVDIISALILIGALLATRPTQLLYTDAVSYYIAALAAVFILLSLGLIIYHTLTAATDYEDRLFQHFGSFELGPHRVSKVDQLLDGWSTEVHTDDFAPNTTIDPSELLLLDS